MVSVSISTIYRYLSDFISVTYRSRQDAEKYTLCQHLGMRLFATLYADIWGWGCLLHFMPTSGDEVVCYTLCRHLGMGLIAPRYFIIIRLRTRLTIYNDLELTIDQLSRMSVRLAKLKSHEWWNTIEKHACVCIGQSHINLKSKCD